MGKKFGEMTPEELREVSRKGGQASVRARRERRERRKEMKGIFEDLLCMTLKSGKVQSIEDITAFANINGKNITVDEALCVRVTQKALNGDLRAYELIRDTIGEKPIDQVHYADITPVIINGEDDILE